MALILNIILAVMFGYLAFRSFRTGTADTVFGNLQKGSQPKKFIAYVLSLAALSTANLFLFVLNIL